MGAMKDESVRIENTAKGVMTRMGCVGTFVVRFYESDRCPLWDAEIEIEGKIGDSPLTNEEARVGVEYGVFAMIDRTTMDSFIVEFRDINTSATEVQEVLLGGAH